MKTIKLLCQFTAAAFLLGLFSVFAVAQQHGPAVNANSSSSQLEMTAIVQTSLQLNISTATGGATVSAGAETGTFTVDLGNVNGLGNGQPSLNVASTPIEGVGYYYSTPITLKPIYSGFADGTTASISVDAGGGTDDEIAVEGAAANSMTTVTESSTIFSGVESGTEKQRFIGFRIARTELAGEKTAKFIYTVTMELD